MFQLFDLVEKSAKVFAMSTDRPNEPIMFPKLDVGEIKDGKNPFCEKNLIFVKFVKFQPASRRHEKRCVENKNTTGLQDIAKYVSIGVLEVSFYCLIHISFDF